MYVDVAALMRCYEEFSSLSKCLANCAFELQHIQAVLSNLSYMETCVETLADCRTDLDQQVTVLCRMNDAIEVGCGTYSVCEARILAQCSVQGLTKDTERGDEAERRNDKSPTLDPPNRHNIPERSGHKNVSYPF